MRIEYDYDINSNLVNVYPPEVISYENLNEYIIEIILDSRIQAAFSELIHFENVKTFNFTAIDVFRASEELQDFRVKKLYKEAIILAKSELQYGMARMFQSFLDGKLKVKIFRTIEEADTEIERLQVELKR